MYYSRYKLEIRKSGKPVDTQDRPIFISFSDDGERSDRSKSQSQTDVIRPIFGPDRYGTRGPLSLIRIGYRSDRYSGQRRPNPSLGPDWCTSLVGTIQTPQEHDPTPQNSITLRPRTHFSLLEHNSGPLTTFQSSGAPPTIFDLYRSCDTDRILF